MMGSCARLHSLQLCSIWLGKSAFAIKTRYGQLCRQCRCAGMSYQVTKRFVQIFSNTYNAGLTFEELERLEGLDALKQICSKQKQKFTVSIEGNIGCGKTTLLEYFEKYPQKVATVREPINKWTNLNGHNMLQLLYEDPKRWSFSFNNYCFLTRLQMHKEKTNVAVKMLERSLYSTLHVFVENSYQDGILSKLEHTVLHEWFDYLNNTHKDIGVDLFVYLRAPPEVCYDRMLKRNRKEEVGVPFEFFQSLHELHEEWLINKAHPVTAPVLILDASQDIPEMKQVYEQHKSEILFGCT